MLDTVRMILCGNYHRDQELPEGWSSKEYVAFDREGHGRCVRTVQHAATDLRMGGSGTCVDWVEVSLPRVLHGSNDRLLSTSEELKESVDGALALVRTLVDRPRVDHFTRVDLVWQFAADPVDWINALRRARHPSIRKPTQEFFDESLHWAGREVHGRLYDKGKECGKEPGKVARFEWQLRGKALPRLLGSHGKVGMAEVVDFQREYRVYRDLCSGFEPRTLVKPRTLPEFFVYCDSEGLRDQHGRTVLDIYGAGRSARTMRRLRRDVQDARTSGAVVVVNFSELLPVDHPPAAVNVA